MHRVENDISYRAVRYEERNMAEPIVIETTMEVPEYEVLLTQATAAKVKPRRNADFLLVQELEICDLTHERNSFPFSLKSVAAGAQEGRRGESHARPTTL